MPTSEVVQVETTHVANPRRTHPLSQDGRTRKRILVGSIADPHLVRPSRQMFLRGIREGRCGNQLARANAFIPRDETFADTGVHGAICRAGLVCKSGEVHREEVLLEVVARVSGHDFTAQL
jgi:hypothetical protein